MRLIRSCLSLSLLMTVVICLWPQMARSQSALGQLQSMGGSLPDVPDVPEPTVDWEGTYESWDITNPGWREWFEPDEGPDEPEPAPTTGAAPVPSGPSPAELQRQREQEERLGQLQAAWDRQTQQQAQQQQREADRQRAFEQAQELLIANFKTPAEMSAVAIDMPAATTGPTANAEPGAYVTSFASATTVLPTGAMGLNPNEWQRARQYQGLIETLSQAPQATPEDRSILELAQVRRNQLWSKAVSVPDLPDDAREALALNLPIVPSESPRLTLREARGLQRAVQATNRQPDPVISSMLGYLYVDLTTQAVEQAGEAMVEQSLGTGAGGRFGNFLGLSKIAVATAKDGTASGIASTVDFLVGQISLPQATIAVTGGRQYANVVYQAQSKFMVDAMKAVGVDFDVEEFWREFKEDMTTGQKAVTEFVSYGPQS